jgi:fucose permease
MYLVIWLVPSVFGDAFAASIVGLVFGPMFPGALGLAIDVLPKDIALVSMAIL